MNRVIPFWARHDLSLFSPHPVIGQNLGSQADVDSWHWNWNETGREQGYQ
jgi:hypothetical protein